MSKKMGLGDFEMVRTLGVGSFGRVKFAKYKARRGRKGEKGLTGEDRGAGLGEIDCVTSRAEHAG